MSYILKALQRAEAERNRGVTPGLNTPVMPVAAEPAPPAGRALPWAVAGGAVASCAVLAWWLWPAEPQRVVVQAPVAVPAAPVPAPAAASAASPAPAAPVAVTSAPASAPSVAQAVPPVPIVAAPPVPEPAPARRPVAEAPVRSAAAPSQPAAVARVAPPTAPSPVIGMAELPPQLRQSLPPLTLGGAIYSPEPANRLLIVNGQVMREKAQIAPDLVLESIGTRGAVFRFRGQGFEVKY
jgi:general secretion pathway protein B